MKLAIVTGFAVFLSAGYALAGAEHLSGRLAGASTFRASKRAAG